MCNLQPSVILLITLVTLANCFPLRSNKAQDSFSNYTQNELTNANILDNILERFDRSANGGYHGLTDPTEQETPEEQFMKYYDCIREKNYKDEEEPRQAMLYQEGQHVELSCNLCHRPDQDINRYNIVWKRLQQEIGQESFVPENSNRFVLMDDKSLVIRDIDVLDAGQYVCMRDGQYEGVYQVDVLFKEPRRVIMEENPEAKPLDEIFLTDHNIHVFTTWSEWSDCNKCGDLNGLRRRIGLCTVKKISKTNPIFPVDMPSIKFYPQGVPCRSTVLPREVARMKYISDRQSETLMAKCFIPCPTVAQVEMVTDQLGHVIRQVDIQYYSFNEVPVIPEMVKREVMHKDAGRQLILTCPRGDKQKENLIRWQNGTTVINPLLIKKATRGRVRIDHSNRLMIRRLRVTDTAPYNCWEGARHVATIKVIVTQPMNKDMKKYISIAGFAMTLLAVIIIALCVCCGGKRRTAR